MDVDVKEELQRRMYAWLRDPKPRWRRRPRRGGGGASDGVSPMSPAELAASFWFESQDPASFTFTGENITGWINIAPGATATLKAINITGGTVEVDGKQMVPLNGTNQMFIAEDADEFNFGDGDFEIWVVVRCDDTNRGAVVGKGNNQAPNERYSFRFNHLDTDDGQLRIEVSDGVVGTRGASADDMIYNDDVVRALGCLRDGDTVRVMRGPTVVKEGALDGTGSLDHGVAFNIGCVQATWPNAAGATHIFKGEIGEVIGFQRQLSATERAGLLSWLAAKWGL